MIVEYIRYEMPSEESQAALVKAYEQAAKPMQASPHCLGFQLTQCEEAESSFILRIEWDSTAGHLEGFRRSPEFRDFYRAIAPFVPNIQEMRHYRRTSVEWQRP